MTDIINEVREIMTAKGLTTEDGYVSYTDEDEKQLVEEIKCVMRYLSAEELMEEQQEMIQRQWEIDVKREAKRCVC